MDEGSSTITDPKHPDFVFVGLNKEANYKEYSQGVDSYLLNGAKLIGTNQDRILAKPGGFEMGNGSIVKLCLNTLLHQISPDIGKPAHPYFGSVSVDNFDLDQE